MLRNLMLRIAANQFLVGRVAWIGRKSGLARRFIAGESLGQTIHVVRGLQANSIDTTLDFLGEGVSRESEAVEAAQAYVRLLQRIKQGGVGSTISIKLTQLGLNIDEELARSNLLIILEEARRQENFVRIDMESSRHTQATLDLFRDCYDRHGRHHVGVVIQSYLYRSEQDVKDLTKLGCNIRLCKGAYMEPPEIAFPRKKDVDENFCRLCEMMLTSSAYSALATHDDKMIRYARQIIAREGVPEEKVEFQMLYGVRRERQLEIRRAGSRMRVYVPFGTQWAPYFMRRLAERPANLLFIVRNLFKK